MKIRTMILGALLLSVVSCGTACQTCGDDLEGRRVTRPILFVGDAYVCKEGSGLYVTYVIVEIVPSTIDGVDYAMATYTASDGRHGVGRLTIDIYRKIDNCIKINSNSDINEQIGESK